jgi:hypothetical protein
LISAVALDLVTLLLTIPAALLPALATLAALLATLAAALILLALDVGVVLRLVLLALLALLALRALLTLMALLSLLTLVVCHDLLLVTSEDPTQKFCRIAPVRSVRKPTRCLTALSYKGWGNRLAASEDGVFYNTRIFSGVN